jgi:hypothetical protein
VGVSIGRNVAVGTIASVTVTPGSGVCTGGDVSAVTAMLESVDVENAAVKAGVSVGAGGVESAPKTAPTIVKFAIVLAASTAITTRRIVIRTRISFSQCMTHL